MSDTKQEIMNVAMQLFAKKGYHSTSIRDITSAAKMNSSMVSYYFQSKEN
ncbi:MAG: helix-turn-helix transcriptional regulator, partial [Weeksellaceae bacterium]|nr:helix-turn-helix transcriptional regulator [Weeksellaceae bacterium]